MITDDLIKKEFISGIIKRDMKLIYETQEAVVRDVFPNGSGALADHLARQPFVLSTNGEQQTFSARVFPYLRFLDIKYNRSRENMHTRRKLALYNRVVYGVLYNETLPDLRYGLTADIRKGIAENLLSANPDNL
jgi:hypothetical protein